MFKEMEDEFKVSFAGVELKPLDQFTFEVVSSSARKGFKEVERVEVVKGADGRWVKGVVSVAGVVE